jgi:nucleotide-binding universal stress UspA family protein
MNLYRHLLCPVDFSDASRQALAWSSRFSKDIGARLTVLHVIDTKLLSVGNLVAAPEVFNELRRRAEEGFAPLKKDPGLKHASFEILEGVPEDVIVKAATERASDLVVMGTHGHTGFERFVLGSVTEKVLHRIQVPLLTLSPSVEEKRTSSSRGTAEVLMAVDLGPESQAVLRHGLALAEHYHAKAIALHAVGRPYVVLNEASFEPLGQMEVERLTDALTATRRKDLEAMLSDSGGGPIEAIVTVGSAFESLRRTVAERPIELTVMGAGDHGESGIRWLGSTCHKMVRWAPCPVLVVR